MIRFNTNVVRAFGAIAIGALLLMVAASGAAADSVLPGLLAESPAAPAALPLDHFWCYQTTGPATGEVVATQDQFNSVLVQTQVGAPARFCTPVRKKHGDATFNIVDPNAHLVFYTIGAPQSQTRKVAVNNQFGRKRLKVFEPAQYLAVPTQKNAQPAPQNLDHFKCYRVKGMAINVPVGLRDQFHRVGNVTVGNPVLLCNPTRKVHNDKIFEVLHPAAHLVCYRLPATNFKRTATATNQFVTAQNLVVQNPNLLCAPSTKREIVD